MADKAAMPTTQLLTLPTKTAYWAGSIAEQLKVTMFNLFVLFYYNQVLGLSGSLCGLALLIATIIDAVTDPLMGSVSDGWRSRWGRRHPFMYGAALPMAAAVYFMFDPLVHSQAGLFAWLLGFSVLARVMMTLYSVPYLALGAEMTSNYHERTVLVAGRSVFGYIGALLVYGLGFGVFFASSDAFENGQLNQAAYPPFAFLISALIALSVLGSAMGTHHLIPSLLKPAKRANHMLKQVIMDTVEAFKNKSFRWLVVGFVVISLPAGVGMALALYMYTFFWGVPPDKMTYLLVAAPVGTLIGYMFAPLIGRFCEKRDLLIYGALGWLLFAIAPVCLHYAGMFPKPSSDAVVVALALCGFVSGLLVSQEIVAVGSMLGDITDEQELLNHKRQEGVFYGAYTFVLKATGGVGAALSGFALDLISWPAGGEQVNVAADIPADTLFQLAMFAGPGLAIGFIPAVWCFTHYRLDRREHQSIISALDARRCQLGAEKLSSV